MRILQGIFRARDNPKDAISSTPYSFFSVVAARENLSTNRIPCK